jgi:hypothetical protein
MHILTMNMLDQYAKHKHFNVSDIKFHENLSSGNRAVHADGLADRQDMTKVIGFFFYFASMGTLLELQNNG